jgi:hypothetical protein
MTPDEERKQFTRWLAIAVLLSLLLLLFGIGCQPKKAPNNAKTGPYPADTQLIRLQRQDAEAARKAEKTRQNLNQTLSDYEKAAAAYDSVRIDWPNVAQ